MKILATLLEPDSGAAEMNGIDLIAHKAAYAANTAQSLLLFLIGITVVYTGEAMHRDRELKIEPVYGPRLRLTTSYCSPKASLPSC